MPGQVRVVEKNAGEKTAWRQDGTSLYFGVGLTLLMPALPFIYGLDGLLWSMPASDLFTFIISLIVIIKVYKQLSVN